MTQLAFLTNDEFLTRVDARTIAQLCSDTGTPVSDLSSDPNLTQALMDASGEIASYALRGGRYTLDDLNNLTDISQAYLQRLTTALASWFLVLRRGKDEEMEHQTERAIEVLEELADGKMVFAVQSAIDAGHMQAPPITIQTIQNQRYIRDSIKMIPHRRLTPNQLR